MHVFSVGSQYSEQHSISVKHSPPSGLQSTIDGVQTPPQHVPSQQSMSAVQALPTGTHSAEQTSSPVTGSGRQYPPQHSSENEHELPSSRHVEDPGG